MNKIILIDRDGIINVRPNLGEYITNWKKFVFVSETLEFMKTASKNNCKFIIISNQAGVGKNLMTKIGLELIHKKMINYLRNLDIQVLDIYCCIHNPNENCFCRKPKPQMFFNAAKDHKFNLKSTFYIGDDVRDAIASNNAGTQSVLLNNRFLKTIPKGLTTHLVDSLDEVFKIFPLFFLK